jgi:membrane protein DedA with SNARE-associated domain
MKIPLWIKWMFFSIIIFTSFVLPLALLEPSLASYGTIALDWAGSNKLLISFIVVLALAADVILPVPNGLTNTFAGRPLAKKIISKDELEEAEDSLKNFNILGLILSRPVPGFAELIAITAGLSKMPFKAFILVVSTANIGVAIIFSGIGAAAIESHSSSLAFFGVAILPASLYFMYIKLYKS